jgi:hypothetical protein
MYTYASMVSKLQVLPSLECDQMHHNSESWMLSYGTLEIHELDTDYAAS